MSTKIQWVLAMALLPFLALTQPTDGKFFYGFKAGAVTSGISDISTTIIRPVFPVDTYSTSLKNRTGITAGFIVYHRFKESKLAIQPEISYAMGGGDFSYSDVNELDYTMQFKYQFLNLSIMSKLYLAGGLYAELGPTLGLNLTGTSLQYNSNMPELGPDLQIQQSLREVLKGKNNFMLSGGIGYESEMGLGISARYNLGVVDILETQANGFFFIENENLSNSICVTVSYLIPFVE
ncbi:MAG: PorT family protein [Saprospiraceae bacterium]|nr:PorT family protein [Saprospiraceae bacterium]